MIQLSLFDTTFAAHPGYLLWTCRRCGAGRKDRQAVLCASCLAACPQRRVGGYVETLTATIAPHDWQEQEPWASDKRNTDGSRRTYPPYYRDEAGIVWAYVMGGMGRYERWQ